MRSRRRTNTLLGLIVLTVAVVVFAQALGLFPAAIYDLLVRAWPALLVIIGLAALLRGRVPLAGVVAIVVSAALTAGIASYAFSTRAEQQREDQREPIDQPVAAETSLLRLRVSALATDVEILRGVAGAASVTGEFVGSSESRLDLSYGEAEDLSATLVVRETRPNPLPLLDAVGRGRLRLELPPDIPVDIELVGVDGEVTLNMGGTRLERLNLNLIEGNALVTLPEYDPIFSENDDPLGTLALGGGTLTLFVPASVGGRFELTPQNLQPAYDPGVYNLLVGGILEARAIESADIVQRYALNIAGGGVRLEVAAPDDLPAATPDA